MRIRKDTNFSANHNWWWQNTYYDNDVCGYAKILIFLQIALMYADTQRY